MSDNRFIKALEKRGFKPIGGGKTVTKPLSYKTHRERSMQSYIQELAFLKEHGKELEKE